MKGDVKVHQTLSAAQCIHSRADERLLQNQGRRTQIVFGKKKFTMILSSDMYRPREPRRLVLKTKEG